MSRLSASAALACCIATGAAAHDLGSSPVHPVLDVMPAALHDIRVEVAETLAPQLLVANHGPQALTVLDDAGRAFVRIGPAGVEADLNADAWYKTLSTAAMPEPAAARDPHSPPRWTRVSNEHSFGWFDARLAIGPHAPTPAMRKADTPASTGLWRIPVRIGPVDTAIAGHFQYLPPPDGTYVTQMIPPAGFPSGIELHVSQGAIPAILLLDPGHHAITLIGQAGEDELRIDSHGVSANTASPTWRHWGQQARTSPQAGQWLPLSQGTNTAWLEPRGRTDTSGENHPDIHWSLPLRIDGATYAVSGVAHWLEAEKIAAR